jgi:CRP-like cAMP-binding protein
MAEEERVALAQLGELHEHAGGEALFSPREVPSALYLVVDGVAEISRRQVRGGELVPVAYVGAGATMAASKVITGTPFEALARFPEGGRTLQWPRTVILRRLAESQGFSIQYLQNLARRVEDRFAHVGDPEGIKLGGRLDHFDLPTILQTVVDSGASGVLEVLDSKREIFGSIFTEDRRIGPMLCGSLAGAEAFFEILVTPPESGSFTFSGVTGPRPADTQHDLPPLLFEAARLQDEYHRFLDEVPAQERLRISGGQPEWRDAGDPELIEKVWRALAEEPCGWQSLAERLPFSRSRVALAVRDMLIAGMVVLDVRPRAAGGSG